MPANLGLAQLSNAFLLVALAGYSLAVLAFAGDFAFGRVRRATVRTTVRTTVPAPASSAATRSRVPALVGASAEAGAGAGREAGTVPPETAAGVSPWVRAALVATSAAVIAHVAGVIVRGLAVHRVPWGNMYEFITALTCVAMIFFLGLMIRYRAYYLGLFVTGAVVVALGVAQTAIYTTAGPLVPALQSYWLSIHVTAMTLATGTYFVGAVLAVVYLFTERRARRVAAGLSPRPGGILRRLPDPGVLDSLAYRTVMFAFPIWTFGIIAGAIWADQAWGRYWGWDPTETWAFITWVVYACFLHARATAGWRGRKAQIVQLAGFACLVFNLVGVSLFITGLHSYAGLN